MDHCVLEWCKLFADPKDKHCWRRVVSKPEEFGPSLLDHSGVPVSEFENEIRIMRSYRDKFVAHLDSEKTMNIPTLDLAYKSVAFYHAHIVASEADQDELQGLPLDFERGYREETDEASKIYEWARKRKSEQPKHHPKSDTAR
jgi:hypothetical protein